MKTRTRILVTVLICAAVLALLLLREAEPEPRYMLLFIGDGMGPAQREAAEAFAGRELVMNHLPVRGSTTTFASNQTITDSAAAATAMACGQKTANGVLGQTPEGTNLQTIAEQAAERGMRVGIVSSVSLDHATPAGFYAHVPSRDRYYEIGLQLAASGFDYFAGGGLVDPLGIKAVAKGYVPTATVAVVTAITNAGYTVVSKREDFEALVPGSGKVLAVHPRLDGAAMPYAADRQEGEPTLAEFTRKGIELLDNERGFFLMVEGGKIDWASHANDSARLLPEVVAFDAAVQAGVAFAEAHPYETLLIVTADHETGGLMIGEESGTLRWLTTGHTPQPVTTTAMGVGAERLAGEHDNTEIYRVMAEMLPTERRAN